MPSEPDETDSRELHLREENLRNLHRVTEENERLREYIDELEDTQHDKAKRAVMWLVLVSFSVIAATLMWPRVEWFFVTWWHESAHWIKMNVFVD
jgi:hypothetical protein